MDGPAAERKTASSKLGGGSFPWAVGLAVFIGLLVILSDCLYVHRSAIIPAREQSASIRKIGEEGGASAAASVTDPHYFVDFDGYYWVANARQMVSERDLRVRWTFLDNHPFGRSVDWSSVFSWYLVLLGASHAVFSGLPIGSAIGAAAYYANPVLMGLLLIGVGWVSYRRLGNLGGATLVLLLALQPALLRDFGYARPDHHGLHLICALGVVLLAVLGGGGWVVRKTDPKKERPGGKRSTSAIDRFALDERAARRWFIASGILGGCGLWIGATQQALVIGCVGVGGFIAMMGATRRVEIPAGDDRESVLRWAPELWRLWGRVGALTSFLAYLVEYFPDHLGMRLEVNHPGYALAWLCAGEILYCVGKLRLAGTPLTGYPMVKLCLLSGGVGLLPILAIFGPSDWYVLKDPLMLRLHSVIGEFQPLFSDSQERWGLARELAPVWLILIGIGFLWSRRSSPQIRALLTISLVPSLGLGVAFLAQVRWGGLFLVASCAIVVPLLLVASTDGLKSAYSRVGALLLLLALGFQLVPNAERLVARGSAPMIGRSYLPLSDEVFARDLSLILGASARRGGPPISVMAGLAEGSRIHAFGPTRASGSQYWENLDGLRDTVDFFADDGEEEALRIARHRKIDYIVVTTELVSMVHMLKHGNNDPKGVEQTLAYRLIRQRENVPTWCRPYLVKGFRWADRCRIYKVVGVVPDAN